MRNTPSCQFQTSEGDGEEGKEGTGEGGCGSGASHPLTFTSPAFRALLPQLRALFSPHGRPRSRSASRGSIASPGSPTPRLRSARESRTRRAVM